MPESAKLTYYLSLSGRPVTEEMVARAAAVIGKRERLKPTGERARETAREALEAALRPTDV
jgi:hypothetical protein